MSNLLRCCFLFSASIAAVLTSASALGVTSNGGLAQYTFERFVADYGKLYADADEYHRRSAIFNANRARIEAFNGVPGRSYRLGVNRYCDLTEEEFNAMFNGRVAARESTQSLRRVPYMSTRATVPDTMNWQDAKNPVLTPVKNQGSCGSCWAHAATESIESMYAIYSGKLLKLSTQQITSCVNNTKKCGGTGGCAGGTAQLAWDYVKSAGGITLDADYPYVSGKTSATERCAMNESMPREVSVYGYVSLPHNDDGAVMEALVQKGPLAVSVDASQWMLYTGGVFDGCGVDGNNITINHAVQLVGYGTDNETKQDYWVVRNSWGEGWGERGYIRLLRKRGNETCVFNNNWNTEGGGCADDPNVTIVACGMCGVLYDVAYPDVVRPPEQGRFAWIAGAAFGGLGVFMLLLMILSKCRGAPSKGYDGFLDESETLR